MQVIKETEKQINNTTTFNCFVKRHSAEQVDAISTYILFITNDTNNINVTNFDVFLYIVALLNISLF